MPFKRPLGERSENQFPPNFIRPLQDKRVVVGQNVTLECQIEGHPDPVVKWLKDGQNVSLCPDYEIVDDGLRHYLRIQNVQAPDSGRFTIQAMNAAGSKQSTCTLIVGPAPTPIPGAKAVPNSPAPPQTPVGPSAPYFVKELKNQPLKPGNEIVLEARVVGFPQPTVEWLKNGSPLKNYRAKTEYDPRTGICSLTIPQMFTDDIGRYTCLATNTNGVADTTASLLPKDDYEKWFHDEQLSATKERRQAMMGKTQQNGPGSVAGVPPNQRVVQNGRPASVAQRQMQRYGASISSDGDMAWLMSESETESELAALENRMGAGAAPVLQTPLRGLRLTEGTDAILQCGVLGNPKPNIEWLKDGISISSMDQSRITVSFKGCLALLKIVNVGPNDSGEYCMIATNEHGEVNSSARVEVFPLSIPDERASGTSTTATTSVISTSQQQQQYQQQQQQPESYQPDQELYQAQKQEQCQIQQQQKEEQLRLQRQQEEQYRIQQQKEEQYRIQQLQEQQKRFYEEQQRQEQQRLEQERLERQRLEQQRLEQYHRQQERLEQERRERELQYQREQEYRREQQQREEERRQYELSQQQLLEKHQLEEARRQRQLIEQQRREQLYLQKHREPSVHQEPTYHQEIRRTPQPQYAETVFYPQSRYHPQGEIHVQPQRQSFEASPLRQVQPQYFVQTEEDPYWQQQSFERSYVQRPIHRQPSPAQLTYQQQYHEYNPHRYQQQQEYFNSYPRPFQGMSAPKVPFRQVQPQANAGSPSPVPGGQIPRPPQFLLIPAPANVKTGDKVIFSAKAIGKPIPHMSWATSKGVRITTGGRYKIDTYTDGSSRFEIDGIEMSDAGTYKCIAENDLGTVQSQFLLNVTESKKVEAPQFTGKFQSVTIFEGDSVMLYCKASGDEVKMSWLRDGAPIKNDNVYRVEDKGNGETILHIMNAKMEHGGWYQCDATGPGGKSSLKGRVVVQKRHKPPESFSREQITLRKVDRRLAKMQEQSVASKEVPKFTSTLKDMNLIEGQSALLEVRYSPADDPNLKVAWLLNGKAILASSRVRFVSDHGYAFLEINPVTVFDQGDYTVIIVNTLGEIRYTAKLVVIGAPTVLTDRSNLSITNAQLQTQALAQRQVISGDQTQTITRFIERPNFHSELKSQEIFVGQVLRFEVKVTPINDQNMRVEWFHNGVLLQASNRVQIIHQGGFIILEIYDVTEKDAGQYVCRITNEVGSSESSATVLIHPRIESLQTGTIADVDEARDLRFQQESVAAMVPRFTQQLLDFHCDQELGRSYFEARITPVNDPTLKVIWLKDGQPLPSANRIQLHQNFGYVSLTLDPTVPEDAGTYTCILHSVHGEAQSSATLTTVSTQSLHLSTQHEGSLAQIGYLEGQKVHIGPQPVERPEEFISIEPPRFARLLQPRIECNENDSVHFEARLQPANDVKMTVEWYHNGAPLAAASRFRPMFDFGYVALDILYARPEDSGTYTLVAKNELGQVESTLELFVGRDQTLQLEPHHPEGLQRIQQLEQSRIKPLEEVPDRECDFAPRFTEELHDREISEHEDIHLALKVEPVNDPTMEIEWFLNGHPVITGSRINKQYHFGFISLNILKAISEDSGTYVVRAKNALGEATKECHINVRPHATIVSETQHEECLDKIHAIETATKYERQEVEEEGPASAPQFIQTLPGDIGEVEEGKPIHLECRVVPVGDTTMSVIWLKNGQPLSHGHRYRTFHDFGFVSLDILDVYATDSGTYTCVATNALGKAETSVTFMCTPKGRIEDQTQHPNSVMRIQEIEAPKPAPAESPEIIKQAPQFVKPLSDGQMVYVKEGDNVYLEAQVVPTDDNTMTYEWLLNGHPLMKAHRFVLTQDFGYIALNILYMYPEDSGTYTLIVRNAAGEAQSTMDIDCAVKGNMITESFHPNSVQRIKELEAPLQPADERPEAPKVAPQIVRHLPPTIEKVHESQTLHLEAQITPIDDNELKVQWLHNGHPLKATSRHRHMNDFGFVSLDIDYIIPEDSGKYTLVISNSQGTAETSTEFDVQRLQSIIQDTQHPESMIRIQEIEAIKPAQPSEAELPPEAPQFTQQLTGPTEILKEGQSVHMDCMVQPINDSNLKIEWFLNGYPIMLGSRIRTMHDFGYVGLEFLHVHPEDTGIYTCKASNAAGEATTEFALECRPRRNIYLDTQHPDSWSQIQEIENREVIREPTPEMTFPPPTFTEQLKNEDQLVEGEATRLECKLEPAGDPTLKVYWTRNNQPLPEGSRFMPARNFDYVNLDILAVYPEDSGVYSCRAVSEFGEAVTSCTVKCAATESLLMDTQHEESWKQVQDIENRRPEEPIYVEPEKVAPRFVNPLPPSLGDFNEGSPVHFECQVEPTNDNKLRVEWYHNGQPLSNGHRFRTTHDFGYISLDILYAFPEDSGEWTCVAINELGEARTTSSFSVAGRQVILDESQHPTSWQRIQEIEAPKAPQPEAPELVAPAPKFVKPIESVERIEGQPAHFETRVTPITDPKMRITWFKDGASLANGNRFHLTSDFGFIGLDIVYTVPEDTGTYTVIASNDQGEDRVEATLKVGGRAGILGDTQHEASWQRIQEIEAAKAQPEEKEKELVVYGAPHFIRPLVSVENLVEGQPAHFETNFEPITDPNLTITWYINGVPLKASSRMMMRKDFGLATLDIQYVLPEDVGEITCIARNAAGEDHTVANLLCQSRASILADVMHDESWRRIQEIEAPKPAPAPAEPTVYPKPTFTQPLQSIADIPEGGVAVLEARVIPVNDPNLKILWFHNDAPLQDSNWHTMTNDFGCVTLRISPVYPKAAGVYSCKAVNDQGTAITSASLSVQSAETLQMDTTRPEAVQRIQQLEALDKFPKLELPEEQYDKPFWTKAFENIDNLPEGEIIELSGFVEPSGDPNLRIEWFLNGAPLPNSNRYRQTTDFGNVVLTIVHVLPKDSGVYTCKASNLKGEASTSATVKVAGYETLLLGTQHPVSWEQIQILETPAVVEEVEEEVIKEKPRFLTQLESVTDVPEGTPIQLEATFQPARDSDLKVIWLKNGQPLGASQLIKTRSELGWATLEIDGVNPDHNGVYTLKIANTEGEASCSATVKVAGVGNILADTQHEESWRQIQEMEAPVEPQPEPPAPVYDTPKIETPIADVECAEGEPVHFECVISPINDPGLQVIWLRNGQPLAHGSKYAISHDFGFCSLDIVGTIPEDQGIYQLKAFNKAGEAVTSATLKCHPKEAILGETQHEESWKRIQEIEAPKAPIPELAPLPKTPPKFIVPIKDLGDLFEGLPAHFEATVEPIDDPDLKIQWYLNGAPISASSRVKMISDFGWIILDVNAVEPRDSGEWTCVASNEVGEDKCSAKMNVKPRESVILDSTQPQSWLMLQELEATKPVPEEVEKVFPPPQITVHLQPTEGLSEGDSVHLEAHFTPIDDPHIKCEWFKDGHPLYHANRHKMVSDYGFGIMDIIHLFAHDAGEYTIRVSNDAGEATSTTSLEVARTPGLILEPQNVEGAAAVKKMEERMNVAPVEVAAPEEGKTVPVFIEPLSAPITCVEGERAHFAARYEPLNDPNLRIQWFLNGNPLKTGSRVKTINEFGYVVLEIAPTYPEDSGDYTCRAVNLVGEAVTSTQLTCTPLKKIISESQLPETMAGAQLHLQEIEATKPAPPEAPEREHGPPKFTTSLSDQPNLVEGQLAHFEAQLIPVNDPKLKIEWFHNGSPVGHSARMKMIHDFGFVVLELMPVEPQDSGKWLCKASNDFGSDEVVCDIQVKGTGGVVSDWQVEQAKEHIATLENRLHRPRPELDQPQREFGPPKFTQELQDLGQMNEGDATAFTCVLEPVGDPSLHIEWLHNGHPIPYSNRIHLSNDFGVISLLIKHLIAQDSGEYKCVARNSKGEATTTGFINVTSVTEYEAPSIVQPLVESISGHEGDSLHMECRVFPLNDPKMVVHWLKDGQPLPEASRFKSSFEFGFATLDVLYAYPEDTGNYELIVVSDKGEARTMCNVQVTSESGIQYAPQAPGATVESLENRMRQHTMAMLVLTQHDAYDESKKQVPEFKVNFVNVGVEEGQYCRFETQVSPINDPYMKVEWFKNGKPVLIGHRFRSTLDFGFLSLDLLYALPDDTGEYTCVVTNKFGQASLSVKLACSSTKHIITESQLPQGVLVSDVKKLGDKPYWTPQVGETPKEKKQPQFTIKPRNVQAMENEPARFECAVLGFPKPRVTWYINGVEVIHSSRYRLTYDGVYYLIITKTRISDAGEVVCIAKNSEGEVLSSAMLDVFQEKDFRHIQLKPTVFRTMEELQDRAHTWQKETLGQLGEAFEKAPIPDQQKLMRVEQTKTPIEPLESQELIEKFTKPRDMEKLSYVEAQKAQFKGLELEPVALKASKIEKYEPEKEEMPSVQLKPAPKEEKVIPPAGAAVPQPDWATERKLGDVEGRFHRMEEPEKEPEIPARDQVQLKPAQVQRPPEAEHFEIEKSRAKLGPVVQGPEQPKEPEIPAKDQVQISKKYQPKPVQPFEAPTIESEPLKGTPPVVKGKKEETTISTKPTPTKLGQSMKPPPRVTQQLQATQAEVGRAARFFCGFEGAQPVTVTWYRNGKEIKPSFEFQISTTNTGSTLNIGKLRAEYAGEYICRLVNVAGTVESMANLTVTPKVDRGKAPDFKQRMNDIRVKQNAPATFTCHVVGSPEPTTSWFKDGQPLPNDGRYRIEKHGDEHSLMLSDTLPHDQGIYECVAKNVAGEARCKARLNVILAQTGQGAEAGPKLEAPRFQTQLTPIAVNEGEAAEFHATYSGSPEPTIRWFRNNEPIKSGRFVQIAQSKGKCALKITQCYKEDIGEYKCEATNPAGKATSVANIVLQPRTGPRIVPGTKAPVPPPKAAKPGQQAADKGSAPQFVSKLTDISARPGHTVKFVAEVIGNPVPTVSWMFAGKPIYNGRDHKISFAGNKATLEIQRVSPSHAGDYSITIRNNLGAAQCQARLKVETR